ncbi:hypothetical protein E4U43_002754 [Claviceps pusilla]|uniref:Uncharacterized protein n=1 Tax=Claviceps pusilla TaxID=123648 RepID=A0A9P7T3Y9_9HYPO|nr:hypothetical protein E4U43_002754 [Claviceps pusilla]
MASHTSTPSKIRAASLQRGHFTVFKRALLNMLFTKLAEFTMAQLVDGLPTIDAYLESDGLINLRGHPIFDHKVLCPGALERTKAFRSEFDPSTLLLKSSTIQAFQSCPPDTREFDLRLLELLAEAVHSIAVSLFNLEEKSHIGNIQQVVNYTAPPKVLELGSGRTVKKRVLPPYPTLFTFPSYSWHEQYPNGVADAAAYWAEDKLFGGVLLFNRGVSGSEVMEFLKGDSSVASPFPLCADEDNAYRYDPYDAMKYHNIYRDIWERKLPEEKDWDQIRQNTFDYPELKSLFHAVMGTKATPILGKEHDGDGATEPRPE